MTVQQKEKFAETLINHFAICCRSRTQNIRKIRKQLTERYFLGSICKNELPEKKNDPWHVKLKVSEIPIILKIDTGADINVISTKTFRKLRKRQMLKPAHVIYKSPRGTLTCKGKFWVNTTHKNKTYRFEIHVIDNNTDNLLSRDTACKMGLVTVVANVNGCMKGDLVKITLSENVAP